VQTVINDPECFSLVSAGRSASALAVCFLSIKQWDSKVRTAGSAAGVSVSLHHYKCLARTMISRMAEKIQKIHTFAHHQHSSLHSQSSPTSPSLAPSITTARTSFSDECDVSSPNSMQSFSSIPVAQKLSDFVIQRTLGTGSFGRVHLGMHLSTISLALS
jgi:hypothetical protein